MVSKAGRLGSGLAEYSVEKETDRKTEREAERQRERDRKTVWGIGCFLEL